MLFGALLLLCQGSSFSLKLRDGRKVKPSYPVVLDDMGSGWYYLHYRNSSDIAFLENDLKIRVDSGSYINNYWVTLFLNGVEAKRVVGNGFFVSKVSAGEKLANSVPLSDSDASYLVEAHETFENRKNYTHMYGNYYVAAEMPDLRDETILSVSPIGGPQLLSRWAIGLSQANNISLKYVGNKLITNRPIHERGIMGDGVVIAMLDSGIDTELCQFKDPNFSVPFNRVDFRHRKIVRYETLADRGDPPRGHGTHVAGIVAGNALCDGCAVSMYNGHAPHAKIMMADAGEIRSPMQLIPNLRLEYVVGLAKEVGASIMSNSWGFPPQGREGYRTMFDRIAHENRDISFFFGAGNSRQMFDCYTPGNSKNTFAVGGVSNLDFVDKVEKSRRPPLVLVIGNEKIPLTQEPWAKSVLMALKSDPIPNFRGRNIGSDFVLVKASCDEITKVPNGTVAVFMTSGGLRCRTFGLPVLVFEKKYEKQFRQAKVASIHIDFKPSSSDWKVSKFNSGGPSDQGLLKPDIMAPGLEIYSAQSSQTVRDCSCEKGLFKKSGTSMAVPAVSGSAALIVQYFRDGYFPVVLSPTSMLVRSLLVNGAIPRNGKPNLKSGFGMIRLENSLAFDDSTFRLMVADDLVLQPDHEMCGSVTLDRAGTLVVTMTYSDPPVNSKSSMPLYADLDLLVIAPNGDVFYNNECRQTTERVVIENTQPGKYDILITGHQYFPGLGIPFSVSATGPFVKSGLIVFANQKRSSRACGQLATGHTCELPVHNASSGIHFRAHPRVMHYFGIEIPEMHPDASLEIVVQVQAWKFSLLQVELSLGQVAKFGGDLLFWNQVTSKKAYRLKRDIHDNFGPGQMLYLTLFEATNAVRDVHVSVNVITGDRQSAEVIPTPPKIAPVIVTAEIPPNVSELDPDMQENQQPFWTKNKLSLLGVVVVLSACTITAVFVPIKPASEQVEELTSSNLEDVPQDTTESPIKRFIEYIQHIFRNPYKKEYSHSSPLGVDRLSDE